MKKNSKLALALAAITLISSLSVCSVNAAEIPAPSVEPCGTICVQHGPYTRTCTGVTTTEPRTHRFEYQGYDKVCEYDYVLAWTRIDCDVCTYYQNRTEKHSHGYRGHDEYCGWINGNDNTCYLR